MRLLPVAVHALLIVVALAVGAYLPLGEDLGELRVLPAFVAVISGPLVHARMDERHWSLEERLGRAPVITLAGFTTAAVILGVLWLLRGSLSVAGLTDLDVRQLAGILIGTGFVLALEHLAAKLDLHSEDSDEPRVRFPKRRRGRLGARRRRK